VGNEVVGRGEGEDWVTELESFGESAREERRVMRGVKRLKERAGGADFDSGNDFRHGCRWEGFNQEFGELEVIGHDFWVGERARTVLGVMSLEEVWSGSTRLSRPGSQKGWGGVLTLGKGKLATPVILVRLRGIHVPVGEANGP